VDFVGRVQAHVASTAEAMAALRPDVHVNHPIPFFGRIDQARALTVAMNPSAGEFRGRGWPSTMAAQSLASRLVTYFENSQLPPHPWFEESGRPLLTVGLRYTSNLAHLDIVPRATKTISRADGAAFRALADMDAWVFFGALDLALAARAVLLSGSITNAHYVHEWVARRAAQFGWSFVGKPGRVRGGPFAGVHALSRGGRTVNVLFTSASVNHWQGPIHYQRLVLAHRDRLRAWLT
jgi:hypothetical protein